MAPRRAARIASSPQPVPISSTRVPSPTPACVEQPLDLAGLRLLEVAARAPRSAPSPGVRRRVTDRGREQRRGVAQRRVEEQPEQVVGQVVVVRRCCRGSGRLVLRWSRGAPGDVQARAARCSRRRHQGGDLGGEHGQEAAEVGVGVPRAGQVGLAEADQAVAGRSGRKNSSGRWSTIVGAWPAAAAAPSRSTPGRPVGHDHGDVEPGDGGPEEPARDDAATRSRCEAGRDDVQARPAVGVDRGGGLRVIGGHPSWWWCGSGPDRQPAQPEPDAVDADQRAEPRVRQARPAAAVAAGTRVPAQGGAERRRRRRCWSVTATSSRSPGTGTASS